MGSKGISIEHLRGQELAWVFLELVRRCETVGQGRGCVCVVEARKVCVVGGRVEFASSRALTRRICAWWKEREHRKCGHDIGCQLWGVSARALQEFLCSCKNNQVAFLLDDALRTSCKILARTLPTSASRARQAPSLAALTHPFETVAPEPALVCAALTPYEVLCAEVSARITPTPLKSV